ncbi:MAG: hypothetical protein OQK12_13570, partial [Motiliproteus sp.]|nr:hypothetical protein [Motiliproteus sp.]
MRALNLLTTGVCFYNSSSNLPEQTGMQRLFSWRRRIWITLESSYIILTCLGLEHALGVRSWSNFFDRQR